MAQTPVKKLVKEGRVSWYITNIGEMSRLKNTPVSGYVMHAWIEQRVEE
jgi:hypothetical protein